MDRQLSVLILALFAFSFTSGEAKAQQKLDPKALPPVDFYHHRLKVQYVNENPDITNTMRSPEPRKVLIFQPPQLQPQQVQYIMAPSASAPGLPPGAVDLSSLPQSGFESNMPLNPNANSRRDSLPQGMSTGGLTGKPMISGRMFSPRSQPSVSTAAPSSALSSGPTQAMAYKPYINGNGSGTTGASNTRSSATVSGKIERGSLIGRTPNK